MVRFPKGIPYTAVMPAKAGTQFFQRCGFSCNVLNSVFWCPKDFPTLASFQRKLEPSSFSDVAFGKAALHHALGNDIKKDIQNCGKNFPVNKAWVPAFAGMTAVLVEAWDVII
jgi:hypothetical protein